MRLYIKEYVTDRIKNSDVTVNVRALLNEIEYSKRTVQRMMKIVFELTE